MAQSIEELMKQLGSMSYTAPSSFKGYQSGMPVGGIGYKKLKGDNSWDFTSDNFQPTNKKKSKNSFKPDLWGVLTGTLGQAGGAVTDTAYHTIDGIKGLFDGKGDLKSDVGNVMKLISSMNPANTAMRGAVAGGKEQLKDWKDGKLTWGDVPGIGFLHGMDKGWKRGQDIMEDHAGVENRWGRIGGGIAIDIAADPLTYLTGGAGMATKLGKAKELAKLAEVSKNMKVAGKFKNVDDFAEAARQSIKAKYPNLSESIVDKRVAKAVDEIKVARNQTYNQNINKWGLSVPFSNKMTTAVGDIKKGNILHRTESTLGTEFRHLADDLISKVAKTPEQHAAVTQKIQQLYGVNKLDELTKTMYADLYKRLSPVAAKMGKALPDSVIKQTDEIDFGIPDEAGDMEKLIKGMSKKPPKSKSEVDLGAFGTWADEGVDLGVYGQWGNQAGDLGVYGKWGEADPLNGIKIPKVTSPMKAVDDAKFTYKDKAIIHPKGQPATVAAKDGRILSKAMDGQFGEMGNYKTGFEHWLDKKNPFDARTLGTGNKFVDSMADHISDMNSQKIGENARYQMGLGAVEKFVKKNNITQDEMMEAIYHLEGKAPESFGTGWQASDRAIQLANKIKPILDDVATKEQAAGVLGKTRKNYFPHIIQKSEEELQKIREFKARNGSLSGMSQVNKNSKSRTGFETMAERDDYIVKLEKAIQSETDPDKIAEYRNQIEDIAQLFDTNVVSALTRRVKEGVRAKAAKEMQGELKKFGMYAKDPKEIGSIRNMQRLTPDEARKLGLGEGSHYMHKDVLNGLKRIDEIFTDQGMNKIVRHLNAFSDAWRSLVTHYKPSHYINNIIGNTINNMVAGVKASEYKAATKLIVGYRNGKLTPAQMKLMEQAYKKNVISGGFISDVKHGYQFDNSLGSEKLADMITDSKLAKKMRHSGELGDDISRLANYLNGINKYGGDVEKAAQQVRTYLFNYNELTNADRAMRVAVPFWNWTKRNIPLQMKLLMENPKVAMNVERFKNLFNEDEPGADWQKEMGVKLPGTDKYLGISSPTNDLNTILNPLSFLGSMHPLPKMGIELKQNKKMLNGQPITYGQDEVAPEDIPGYLAKNFGVTGNVYDGVTGKRSFLESLAQYFLPTYQIPENEK